MRRLKEDAYRREFLNQGLVPMSVRTKKRLEDALASTIVEIEEKTAEIGASMDSAQDWHDNAAFDVLQQELSVLETRQATFRSALNNAVTINSRQIVDTAQQGNTIEVQYADESESETFTILGPYDGGTDKSWISSDSPLAVAMIGHKAGETIILNNGTNIKLVKILPGNF